MDFNSLCRRIESHYGIREARAIVRLVFEQKFNLSYADILCDGIDKLSKEEKIALDIILRRLETGEPIQYILGKAEFCGKTFRVTRGVLIPRPETEMLVHRINKCTKSKQKVLDIGCGSGCIGISLALEHPDWEIEGWDISQEALKISMGNAKAHEVNNILFTEKDILIQGSGNLEYDIIVSNPPYILNKERATMESHVLDYEPHTALFVPDDDPLLFYRHIASFASEALKPGGQLVFEINREYGKQTEELMKSYGFSDITTEKDIYGNDRMVTGYI